MLRKVQIGLRKLNAVVGVHPDVRLGHSCLKRLVSKWLGFDATVSGSEAAQRGGGERFGPGGPKV
jgi:hypothetical protein